MGRGKFKGKPTGHRQFSTPEQMRKIGPFFLKKKTFKLWVSFIFFIGSIWTHFTENLIILLLISMYLLCLKDFFFKKNLIPVV
jgi:hypothetical protein